MAGCRVLDFGCGDGALHEALLARGFDAWGCDFADELDPADRRSEIEQPYRLPYPDDHFDVVLSEQVFEHVQDYGVALDEIRRVLRPAGVSIHHFPPRWCLIEPHILVPLGGVIQSRWWLRLWATVGVRNRFQKGLSASDVADLNHRFLLEHTTYYSRRELLRRARLVFPDARLLGLEAAPTPRGQRLYRLTRRTPWLMWAWCESRRRILVL